MAAGAAVEPGWITKEGSVRTIAIVNQKGGCGKTTTAIHLAAAYAHRGFRTLLVDLDPQAHCAAGLGVPERRIEYMIGDAMLAETPDAVDRSSLVWEVCRNLDLAPALRSVGLRQPCAVEVDNSARTAFKSFANLK